VRIVLYTHHSLFEPALSLAEALAETAEVHLLLEVPAGAWELANFEASAASSTVGMIEADPVLAPYYPSAIRDMWRTAASFHLVVPGERRSRSPGSVALMVRVLEWIRALRPDVLHIDDIDVSPRLAFALALLGSPCPLLMGCHDPDPHSGERRWRLKMITRSLVFPRCDALLVHHGAGRLALNRRHRWLRRRVYAVHLGVYTFLRNLSPDAPASVTEQPTVLLFGRITPYKGVEDLFDSAPLVAREIPGVRFVVAGKPVTGYSPPEAPTLENRGRIDTMYGYIPGTDTGRLFYEAQVAVCPYTDASQSGVVLTAFAFGCPVVVTDVGGLPEYVTDGVTGLVVKRGDREALAEALIRCLSDATLKDTLRAGIRTATAGDLSWQRTSAQLLEIYSILINEKPPGRLTRLRSGSQRT
jgi:glycosyltransferase involved in cell wall biosynthesis